MEGSGSCGLSCAHVCRLFPRPPWARLCPEAADARSSVPVGVLSPSQPGSSCHSWTSRVLWGLLLVPFQEFIFTPL